MIEAEMMFILNHFESFVLIDLMEALATRDTEVGEAAARDGEAGRQQLELDIK